MFTLSFWEIRLKSLSMRFKNDVKNVHIFSFSALVFPQLISLRSNSNRKYRKQTTKEKQNQEKRPEKSICELNLHRNLNIAFSLICHSILSFFKKWDVFAAHATHVSVGWDAVANKLMENF